MYVFPILLGLIIILSSFSIPDETKRLRHILPENDRNDVEKGGTTNFELVKRNWDDEYQRHKLLPACNTIRKSGNAILSCNTYTAFGDNVMKCEASCPKNYEFSNGSSRKTVSCVKKYDANNRNPIQMISCKPKEHTEFKGPNKVTERLPECHRIRKPTNSRQFCKRGPGSSYEDPTMECQISCNNNYAFPDGSSKRTIACALQNRNDDWNTIAKIPRCIPKGNELLENSKSIKRKLSLPACSSIKPPENGLITCIIDYSYQDNLMDCVPSCKKNYEFSDGSYGRTITCTRNDKDGAWNKYIQIPNCR